MNKKYAIPIVAILGLSIAAWGIPNTSVMAAPATVLVGINCGLFDGDGGFLITTDTQAVQTQSANGNTKITCHAASVPNSTGKAVHYDTDNNPFGPGALCGDGFGNTTADWKEVVSDNEDGTGDATLQCRFKN
jgi:hypothetical protein